VFRPYKPQSPIPRLFISAAVPHQNIVHLLLVIIRYGVKLTTSLRDDALSEGEPIDK
jgi:hypothetical protein